MSKIPHTVFVLIIVAMLILSYVVPQHGLVFILIGVAVAIVSLVLLHMKKKSAHPTEE